MFVHVIKTYRGNGDIPPFILNLDTRWMGMVNFTPRLQVPIEKEVGWVQNRFGRIGEEKNVLSLIVNRTLDPLTHSPVSMPTELSRILILEEYKPEL